MYMGTPRKKSRPVVHTNRSSLSIAKKIELRKNDPNYSVLKRVKGFAYNMFLFSAVVSNSTASRPWDTIVLQGWEHQSYENRTFGCCIKYRSGEMMAVKTVRKIHWAYRSRTQMPVKQYICRNEKWESGDLPEMVTLSGTTASTGCHKLYNWYIKPTFAYENKYKIAVCAKVGVFFYFVQLHT